jgi:anti-sigma B factor antagonist
METAIGVFISRTTAEEAVKELLSKNVPKDSIVFLTRSDTEATFRDLDSKYAGIFAGGAAGLGIAAVTLLAVPGIGQVVAVGFGAAALLGLVGAGTGVVVGKAMTAAPERPQPTAAEQSSEDAAFFRDVLQRNRSLVVVRTDSQEVAKAACEVLDRLGIGMEGRTSIRMRTATRQVGGITVLDISGRITLGEGNIMLREIVQGLIEKGNKNVLLNLGEVEYVDSAGVGELVRSFTTIRKQGGQLKLVNLNKKVRDLLEATNLHRVFEIQEDEASAIKSFSGQLASGAAN